MTSPADDRDRMPAGKRNTLPAVHVIVTCANRKTAPVPPELHLGSVRAHGIEQRASRWITRLADPGSAARLPARDLYAGEHWMIARSLEAASPGQVRLWVCSAGYGLIPAGAAVRPYAAAFSGESDRVPGGSDGARQWWAALSGWDGPAPGEPRSIAQLTASAPSALFLVALSGSYLSACRDDVAAAAARTADPDSFMVICAGAKSTSSVPAMVPADARLQAVLGGTRQALNVRIAARLLSIGITGRAEAVRCLTRLLAGQPPVARYERKKLSDEELSGMIASRLSKEPRMSASRMLREFRDSGLACEQGRFGELHRVAAGGGR